MKTLANLHGIVLLSSLLLMGCPSPESRDSEVIKELLGNMEKLEMGAGEILFETAVPLFPDSWPSKPEALRNKFRCTHSPNFQYPSCHGHVEVGLKG